jgi:hypothetical protein
MEEVTVDEKWLHEGAVEPEEEPLDPLSPEFAPGLSLIVLMRIYEVQLAILRETNAEVAQHLFEAHSKGIISTPMPWLDPEASGL